MSTTFSEMRKSLREGVVESSKGELLENADELEMMKGQVKSMRHFLDGIDEHLSMIQDSEEWFQNKLTKAHTELQAMYSYAKGKDINERELTSAEKKEVEKVAKELPDDDFKKRYGEKWLSVKIATATNIVKNKKKDSEKNK